MLFRSIRAHVTETERGGISLQHCNFIYGIWFSTFCFIYLLEYNFLICGISFSPFYLFRCTLSLQPGLLSKSSPRAVVLYQKSHSFSMFTPGAHCLNF